MKPQTVVAIALKNLEQSWYKLTRQRHKIIPYKVVVELTTQCNSRCITCDIWKIKKEYQQKIDLNQFENFLRKMDKHLLWLALTGGEVSSYNQFPKVVSLIKKYCPNLRILTFTTNGLLPQRILDFALLMKREINCDVFITISLDGDEATHDKLRGVPGNFKKCMEAYELLKQHSIPSHFGITVSESNHSFITKSYKKFNHLIKAVTLYHTGGIFLTEQKSDYNETDKKNIESLTAIYQNYQPQNMGEWLVKMYLKLGILFLRKGRKTNIVTCDVGLSTAHLMANGDLQPCMYLPPITRLSDNFDLTCYHSKSTEAILEDIRQNKCPHCWMSCYGPHNMLQAPIQTFKLLIKPL